MALLVGGAHPAAFPDLRRTSGITEARSEAKSESESLSEASSRKSLALRISLTHSRQPVAPDSTYSCRI